MKAFNYKKVRCPHCNKTQLKPIMENDRVIAYFCAFGCKSLFDVDFYIDIRRGMIFFLVRQRNPDYLAELNSEDIYANLEKTQELEDKGIPFYSNTYVLDSKPLEDTDK